MNAPAGTSMTMTQACLAAAERRGLLATPAGREFVALVLGGMARELGDRPQAAGDATDLRRAARHLLERSS